MRIKYDLIDRDCIFCQFYDFVCIILIVLAVGLLEFRAKSLFLVTSISEAEVSYSILYYIAINPSVGGGLQYTVYMEYLTMVLI